MKKIFLLIASLLLIYFTWAQPKNAGRIYGTVTDAKTGRALAGVSVLLSESKTGTITDASGGYRLTNVPTGRIIIEVSIYGYRTIAEPVVINSNTEKNFTLATAVLEIEGITVTGVANATNVRKTPVFVTRIDKKALLAAASTNIIDAISHQPGVSQITTGPAISKPVIRGLGYNRLVVINDGLRQEGQQWGDEHGIEIDENSVNRIEVLKGPASLIYGSDALAGVINIVTTTPAPVNTVRGNVLSSYQTNNKQRSFFASIGGNQNGFNWNLWGDYAAAADYKNKYDGYVFNSKFNNRNFGGYAGYNGSWGYSRLIVSNFNQRLGLIEGERNDNGHFVKAFPNGAERAAAGDDFRGSQPDIPYQHIQHFKIISDNSFKAGSGRLSLNLGWQRNQRMEFGNPDAPDVSGLHFDLRTLNYNAAYHFAYTNGWNTSIGLNGMVQSSQNKGEEALIPAYSLFDIGGYVYSQKTVGKSTVSGGLRFDNRTLDAKALMEGSQQKFSAFTKNFFNVSASGGISYEAGQTIVLKANVAKGFRAPSIPELASNGAHEGTNRYEYGNLNLKSENSFQADLGFEANTDHMYFTATAFYNSIRNFIFYSRLTNSSGNDSLVLSGGEMIPAFQFGQHDARLMGVEGSADLHPHPLDWLHWQNTFSYVRGRFTEAVGISKNIPSIPASRLISELRGEWLPQGKSIRNLVVSFEADHTFNQHRPFTSFETETPTDGYTLLNAHLSANIISRDKVKTLFSLFVSANNIGNAAYQNHLSRLKYTEENPVTGRTGIFNMGRNYSLKLNIPLSFGTGKKLNAAN